jgi:uncharacterized protein YodC (DUF2158 family)
MAQQEPKFKVGDKVTHKSGGPILVINQVAIAKLNSNPFTYRCQWFNGKKLEYGFFAEAELDKKTEDAHPDAS